MLDANQRIGKPSVTAVPSRRKVRTGLLRMDPFQLFRPTSDAIQSAVFQNMRMYDIKRKVVLRPSLSFELHLEMASLLSLL
jgi:hypothetical protein